MASISNKMLANYLHERVDTIMLVLYNQTDKTSECDHFTYLYVYIAYSAG